MDLELTKRCNLRCIYCYADGGAANKDELTLQEIIDAVAQAKALGAK